MQILVLNEVLAGSAEIRIGELKKKLQGVRMRETNAQMEALVLTI